MARLSDRIGSFTTIPDAFIKNSAELSARAKWVFVCLRHYVNGKTDVAFPSYDELQNVTGLARRFVSAAIKELITAGWVEKKRRYGRSTVYATRIPDHLSSSPVGTTDEVPSSSPVGTFSSSYGVNTNQMIEPDDSLGAKAPTQNISVADATQPKTQNNTSRTDMDYLDLAFNRMDKQKGNPDAKSEATIRRWNLPPHLTDICLQFVGLAHVPVMLADKGKWSKGARDLHELGAEKFMRLAFEAGRKDGLTLTWPGAMVELCRKQIAEQKPVEPVVVYKPVFN